MQIYKLFKLIFLFDIFILSIYANIFAQQVQASKADADFLYAEQLANDGYIDLAIEQYRGFLQKYPEEKRAPVALRRIADGYFRLKKFSAARAAYEKLILRYPETPYSRDALFFIGQCFVAEGDKLAGAKSFERFGRLLPGNDKAPNALIKAAKLYLELGRQERGRRILFEVIEQYPQNEQAKAKARLALVKDFTRAGEYDRALQAADAFLQQFSDVLANGEVWLTKARLHKILEQYGKALDSYEEVRSQYSQLPVAFEATLEGAELQFLMGKSDSAHQWLGSIRSGNDSLRAIAAIEDARLFLWEEKPAQALQSLQNVSQSFRNSYIYWQWVGRIQATLQNYADALAAFQNALDDRHLQSDSLRAELLLRAAKAAFETEDSNRALGYLKALKTLPTAQALQPELLFLQAQVYDSLQHDYSRAIRAYSAFLEKYSRHPKIDEAQARLARCYESLQDWPLAQKEWQKLSLQYPASSYYPLAVRHLQLISKYYRPDFASLADQLAKTLYVANDGGFYQNPRLTSAEIYLEFKEFKRAIPVLKKVLAETDEAPARSAALNLMGEAYFALGEKSFLKNEEATAAWFDSARIVFHLIQNKYPNGAEAEKIDRYLGLMALYVPDRANLAFLDSLSLNYQDLRSFDPIHIFVLERQLVKMSAADSLTQIGYENRLQGLAQKSSAVANKANFLLAKFYLLQRDTSKALSSLQQLEANKRIDPDYIQAQLLQCRLLFSIGRNEESKNRLKILAKQYFYSSVADSALLFLARIALAEGKPKEALGYLQDIQQHQLVQLKGRTKSFASQYQYLLAQAYQASSADLKATQAYLAFLRHHRQSDKAPEAILTLAEMAKKMQAIELAKDYYSEVIQSYAGTPFATHAKLLLALLEYDRENFQPARKMALEVFRTSQKPDEIRQAMRLAILAGLRQGQLAGVEDELKNYATKFPNDLKGLSEIQYELGEFYLRQKNFKKAESIFKKIKKNFKETEYGIRGDFGLGKSLLIQNKTEEALDILTEIPRRYPGHPFLRIVYLNLGDFYQAQQQWANAINAFQKVLADSARDKTFQFAMKQLIGVYERAGLYDRALGVTRQYLKIFPNDDRSLTLRIKIGSLLRQIGQYDEAIRQYHSLQAIARGEAEAEIQYYIAESYFEAGRFEKAIVEYLRLKYLKTPTKFQWRTTAIYKAGICYVRLQKYPEARKLFELIVREKGAGSVFGRSAQERIQEIEQVLQQKNTNKTGVLDEKTGSL